MKGKGLLMLAYDKDGHPVAKIHWHEHVKLMGSVVAAVGLVIGGLFWLFTTSLPSAQALEGLETSRENTLRLDRIERTVGETTKQLHALDLSGQLSRMEANQQALKSNQSLVLSIIQKQDDRMDRLTEKLLTARNGD